MKLSIREKKVLYDFACPNYHNTVTRLKWLTALTVDPQAKHRMLELARKLETEMAESWYTGFYDDSLSDKNNEFIMIQIFYLIDYRKDTNERP